MLARRMEEYDAPADLGEIEGEEDFVFPPNERRLITQPLDLSIQTLLEQWDNKLLILPEIQREYVWDNGKASRLIESLILNIPIPVLYFSETQEAKYEIIDGHQRVRSIVRYLNNDFVLSGVAAIPARKVWVSYTHLRLGAGKAAAAAAGEPLAGPAAKAPEPGRRPIGDFLHWPQPTKNPAEAGSLSSVVEAAPGQVPCRIRCTERTEMPNRRATSP